MYFLVCKCSSLLYCVLSSDLIKEVLSLDDEIHHLATELYQQKSVLIMGRGYHYATCLEGALVSQLHTHTHTHTHTHSYFKSI